MSDNKTAYAGKGYPEKGGEEVKYWKCPKCAFLTTNVEMQSIVFEPRCRCYNRTGMTWGNFVPVIEEKSKKY